MIFIKKFYPLVLVALLIGVYSCNSNDTETKIDVLGTNGQISSFSVAGTPENAIDTLTYPYLPKTFFTVISNNDYKIFNLDSLPINTEIKTLAVTLKYIGNPSGIELIYLDKNRVDSLITWNTSDSVKFIFDETNSKYYPDFNVISSNGALKRRYSVDFRIHKVDPYLTNWERPKTNNSFFILPKFGDSKVVIDSDTTTFYTLIQDETSTELYVSPINNPGWVTYNLNLPTNLIISTFFLNNNIFSVLDENGAIYQIQKNDLTQDAKKINTSVIYKSVIGVLPDSNGEILVVYYNSNGELIFGKTTDFVTVEPINISGSTNGFVDPNFPLSSYAQTSREINNSNYIVLTGGTSITNDVVKKSWYITNGSESTATSPAEVVILPGKLNGSLPFESGISTFVYNDSIRAFSGDSLRLYTSKNGQDWDGTWSYNALPQDMGNLNSPSIIVDKDKYIWVIGGRTPLNEKGGVAYYRDIWRGRMNEMTFEPVAVQ